MRLMEAMRLRVKDIEFTRCEMVVRDGKGGKDHDHAAARAQSRLRKFLARFGLDWGRVRGR